MLLEKNKYPFKQFLLSKTNYNKRKKKNLNFIINAKSIDSRVVKQKILDVFSHKTNSKSRKKDLAKKDESMESLDENSIWNDCLFKFANYSNFLGIEHKVLY